MNVGRRRVNCGKEILVMGDAFMAEISRKPLLLLLVYAVLGTHFALPTEAGLIADVTNPPPSISDTIGGVPQTAVAYTATEILASAVPLQQTLDAQGFTNANNWTLNTTAVDAGEVVYNLTQYTLQDNPGVGFGEKVGFSMLSDPAGIPAAGPGITVTLHWLQVINTNAQVNGYGFTLNGQPGVWQADNGQSNGAKVNASDNGSGTNNGNNGPYYDSGNNSMGDPDKDFSVPPAFFDFPHWYSGIGTSLLFDAFPTWDVYNATAGTDTMYVASEGVQWGFQIVPEPASIMIWGLIVSGCGLGVYMRRRRAAA
jgi:hypothetical protein